MQALSDRVAALEVSQLAVRAVVLGVDRGQPVLHRASEVLIDSPNSREGESSPLYRACQKALGQLRDEVVVSSVEATDVLVRQIHLEVTKEREIEQTLQFQIEPLLPFPVDEAILDHALLTRNKEGAEVAVLTVPKERLRAHLDRMTAGGVNPERTSCIPAALAALLFRIMPSAEAQGVVYLGDEATTCAIVRQGRVLGCRAVACGAKQLMEGAHAGEVDFALFDPSAGFRLYQRAEALRSEVARAFFALTSQDKGGSIIGQIFLTGVIDSLRNFDNFLSHALEIPFVRLPEHSPFCSPLGDITRFAVPLGLALQALPLRTPRIDFRKGEFAYPRPWRRLQRPLIIYFCLCLVLAIGLLAVGAAMRARKQLALNHEYETLSQRAREILPPESLPKGSLQRGPAAIAEATRSVELSLKHLPQTHPLLPKVPRVSDVLAWLSTHPRLVQIDPHEGAHQVQIHLQGFRYALVSYPTPKRPLDHYQVRVDLEFTAENPTLARELHDALLEPNEFIDLKNEVKWSQSRGLYRVSFFLKDRTDYPELTA